MEEDSETATRKKKSNVKIIEKVLGKRFEVFPGKLWQKVRAEKLEEKRKTHYKELAKVSLGGRKCEP